MTIKGLGTGKLSISSANASQISFVDNGDPGVLAQVTIAD